MTGPRGERVDPEDRWDDIRDRYGPDHVVTRSLDEVQPTWCAAVERTRGRMAAAGIDAASASSP